MKGKKKVVIIGAGAAGVSCAYHLNKLKYDVEILEARDRIGGRIHSYPLSTTTTTTKKDHDLLHEDEEEGEKQNKLFAELGAAYIHGTVNNPVFDATRLFGMKFNTTTGKRANRNPEFGDGRIYYDYDGSFINHKDPDSDYQKANNRYKRVMNQVQKDAQILLKKSGADEKEEEEEEKEKKSREVDVDIETAMNQAVEKLGLTELEAGGAQKRVYEYLRWQQEHWEGGDLNRTSLKNWISGDFEFLRGGNVVLKNGYVSFLTQLAQTAKLNITLNTTVKLIHWSHPQQQQQQQPSSVSCPPVALTLDSGQVITCDYVVITASIGVLQRSVDPNSTQGIRFQPSLPPWKITAIQNLTMGLLDKVMLRFRHTRNIPSYISHWAHIGDQRGKWPWWYVLDMDTTLIVAWTGTKYAWEAEQRSDEDIKAEVLGVLRKIEQSNVQNQIVKESKELPSLEEDLVEFKFTRWGNDELSFGSYSHLPPGANGSDNEAVGRNVENVLFFCGEATERKSYGTVHGAFQSGRREGLNINLLN